MKKIVSFVLVFALLTTAPAFADTIPKADPNKNKISAPYKIKQNIPLTFVLSGDRQNAEGSKDNETRYTPYSFEVKGPEDYYNFAVINNKRYAITRTFPSVGIYRISAEFKKEYYDQESDKWKVVNYMKKTVRVRVKGNKVRVVLNANKGRAGKKKRIKKVVTYGDSYGKLKRPKRENHRFKGWFSRKKGGKRVTQLTKVNKRRKHVLYAQWEKKDNNIKASKNNKRKRNA